MDTTKKKHKRWNRDKCLKKLNEKTLYGHYLWCKKEGRDISWYESTTRNEF